VEYSFTRFSIEKEGRGGSILKRWDPVSPSKPKIKVLHNAKEVWPVDNVKNFRNIKLYEKWWSLFLMQFLNNFLDISKVVTDTPLLDEGRLVDGNQLVQLRA
jgi:hypothetical protein